MQCVTIDDAKFKHQSIAGEAKIELLVSDVKVPTGCDSESRGLVTRGHEEANKRVYQFQKKRK